MEEKPCANTHILAIPLPMMGHMTPMVQLCRLLIAKLQGRCRVTMVLAERDVPSMLKLLTSHDNDHAKHINILALADGLPLDLGAPNWDTSRALLHSRHVELPRSFAPHMPNLEDVACVISDVFMSWAQDIADRLHVPRIALWSSGIVEFQVLNHAQELINLGKLPFKVPKGRENEIDNMFPERSGRPPKYHRVDEAYADEEMIVIPGLPPLSRGDFPNFLQIEDPTDVYFYIWIEEVKAARKASMVLFNTFNALDSNWIGILKAQGFPAHTIGPLLLEAETLKEAANAKMEHDAQREKKSSHEGVFEDKVSNECIQWLDNQPPRSVLYVAFGSFSQMTKTQISELALGLQTSGQPFIWANRQYNKDREEEEGFPRGFVDSVVKEGKGLIVQWAPQRHILEHIAVGGFLSHSGWNSMVEAICYGVPMIGLPFGSDQFILCNRMVDEWRMGIRLRRDPASSVALAHDVAMVIQELFLSEKGEKLREGAQELMRAANSSIQLGGSSLSTLDALVKLIT